jgi:hypothetical protein
MEVPGNQRFCKYCGTSVSMDPPLSLPPERAARSKHGPVIAGVFVCLLAIGVGAIKLGLKKPWNPSLSFSASDQQISQGGQSTLQWSSAGATRLELNGEVVPAKGSRAVQLAQTASFRLVAYGPGSASESRQITVSVAAPVVAPTIRFTGDRNRITVGQSVTLRWSVTGATRVQIDPYIGLVALEETRTVSPRRTTEYAITADGPGGRATDRFKVLVDALENLNTYVAGANSQRSQNVPRIIAFDAAPASSIQQCQMVVLRWTVQDSSRISIEPGVGDMAGKPGWRPIWPLRDTTYVLTAEGRGGSVSRSVTIHVAPGNRSSCGR